MNIFLKKTSALQFVLISLLLFSACTKSKVIEETSPERNTKTMPETKVEKIEPSTNIAKLSEAIKLEVKPSEAIWHSKKLGNAESRVPGPTDYQLIAVLKFSDEDKDKFEKGLKKDFQAKSGNVDSEEWFPDTLKKDKKISGEKFLVDQFLRPPFSDGVLLKVADSDYYILKIYSM